MKNQIYLLALIIFLSFIFTGCDGNHSTTEEMTTTFEQTTTSEEVTTTESNNHNQLEDLAYSIFGYEVIILDALIINHSSISEVYPIYRDIDQIGYLFQLDAPNSYSGALNILVGVNNDGEVVNIEYLTVQETFADRLKTDEAFNNQFTGYTGSEELDTISGVTISSNSVISAVKIALDYYVDYLA